jgi:hypothetical protein
MHTLQFIPLRTGQHAKSHHAIRNPSTHFTQKQKKRKKEKKKNANNTISSVYSLLLMPSSRNLTSFSVFEVGFQLLNCSRSCPHSAASLLLTIVSSNIPRKLQGRKYGFPFVGNSNGWTFRGTSGQSVVSKAWRTPRL